ncbi:MAG TPA: glycosyltransferase [Isosphaeraceae bacterium]|nr:glycosyltransferase [Isosphaeraceae bacterium]
MLNVLQLIPTLDRSGAEKQMVLLAKGLPRDRFHVEAAALTRLGPLEAELRDAGVPVTRIGKPWKVDPLALARLTRFLTRKRFDVVQTWVFAANAYGRVAAHLAKTPVVVTAEMAVDLWKTRGHLAIDRRLARWCDKVVGNSNAVVDFYRRAGIADDKLAMIYSGIDAEEPPAVDRAAVLAAFGWPADSTLLLFAGRLVPQKGVADLVAALDVLQHIRPKLKALIVGGGPLLSELEETAHAFRLDGAVKFLGHRDDVPRLLAAADLLVLPSRYEGLPNVVLEAMRSRKAVVATAAPGTTEVVADGETGLLVPVGDAVALARAIRTLADDPVLRLRLGEAGRARVDREFGVNLMVDRFAELYESLARSKGLAV